MTDSKSIIQLVKGNQISKVLLDGCYLTNSDIDNLAFALEGNKSVETIDLSYNEFNLFKLIKPIMEHRYLKSLQLCRTKLGNYDIKLISDLLLFSTSITTLGLGFNKLDASDLSIMKESLMSSKTLEEFSIPFNPIGDHGARILADILDSNSVIKTLVLTNCSIEENGVASLTDSISRSKTFLALYISVNPIGNAGLKSIAKCLSRNQSLQYLSISNTHFEKEVLIDLFQALESNLTLKELICRDIKFDFAILEKISKSLIKNKGLNTIEMQFKSNQSSSLPISFINLLKTSKNINRFLLIFTINDLCNVIPFLTALNSNTYITQIGVQLMAFDTWITHYKGKNWIEYKESSTLLNNESQGNTASELYDLINQNALHVVPALPSGIVHDGQLSIQNYVLSIQERNTRLALIRTECVKIGMKISKNLVLLLSNRLPFDILSEILSSSLSFLDNTDKLLFCQFFLLRPNIGKLMYNSRCSFMEVRQQLLLNKNRSTDFINIV
ncbi:hypothetical protein BC833DRAFT_618053 [Globomyces pollinis-pini]|nr:hypothetical protein BC833DRAFT_618053 [Globomyces pollinis-pini]